MNNDPITGLPPPPFNPTPVEPLANPAGLPSAPTPTDNTTDDVKPGESPEALAPQSEIKPGEQINAPEL